MADNAPFGAYPRVTTDGTGLLVPNGNLIPINTGYTALKQSLIGTYDQTLLLIGDSTGNETSEWFYRFCTDLVSALPGVYVDYRLFDDAVGEYGAATVLANAANEPYVTVGADKRGWAMNVADVSAEGADLDVRVDVALDAYTGIGEQVMLARYGASGSRGWYLHVNTSGAVRLTFTTDGATNVVVTSTANLTTAAGARTWIRATLDGDNGAGGYSVMFYTSSNGVTWTQLGSTVVGGAPVTLFNAANQTIEVGSRGSVNATSAAGTSGGAVGKYYAAYAASAIGGANRIPADIRSLNDLASMNGARFGYPALHIYNGSISGSHMEDTGDATRAPKMIPLANSAIVFLSSSHNEGAAYLPSLFLADLATLVTRLDARLDLWDGYIANQNPQYTPKTAQMIASQQQRAALIAAIAKKHRWGLIDSFRAFGTDAALVNADGVHPVAAGSIVWANAAKQAFGLA